MMRTYNKYHIHNYKNSSYCADKYKDMSVEELQQLQHQDDQLKLEITFNNLITRVNSKHSKLFKQYDEEIQQALLKDSEVQYMIDKNPNQRQLKKIKMPVVHEVVQQATTSKDYRSLFADDIIPDLWSKQELVLRQAYLQELESQKKSVSGCTGCKKNALIRKYVSKAQQLVNQT